MRRFLVAVAVAIGTSLVNAAPSESGVLVDIKKGISYAVNDGNPRLVITDGIRATVLKDSQYEYPLGSDYGETGTRTLSNSGKREMASWLTKCNAGPGGSWDTEFTYRYYVEGDLWLCR